MDEVATKESKRWRTQISDQRLFDPPLTTQGFIQAKDRGKLLQNELLQIQRQQDLPKCIYVSPLQRTLGTAYEIAKVTKLPIIVVPGLSACAAAVKRGGLIRKKVRKKNQQKNQKRKKKDEYIGEIVWVDSSPAVAYTGDIIKQNGYKLTTFNETQDCIDYVVGLLQNFNHKRIKGIITSSMRSGGRKEKGLLDGFEMIQRLFSTVWSRDKENELPVTALVTSSVMKETADENDIDIFVDNKGDPFKRVQNEIIEQIQNKFEDDGNDEEEKLENNNDGDKEEKKKDDDYELFLNDYGWIGRCNFLTKKEIIKQFGSDGVDIKFDYRYIEKFKQCVTRLVKESKDNTVLCVTHREGVRKLDPRLRRTRIPYCAMAKYAVIDSKNSQNNQKSTEFAYFTD